MIYKKSLLSVSVLFTLATTFNGCTPALDNLTSGLTGSAEYVKKDYQEYNPQEMIQLSKPDYFLENEKIVLENGDVIMDEDGTILAAGKINGTIYHVSKVVDSSNIYLKNEKNEIIKDFGKSYNTKISFSNNKFFIAVSKYPKVRLNPSLFSNFYSFDGKKVSLIDKDKIIQGVAIGNIALHGFINKYDKVQYFINDLSINQPIRATYQPLGGYSFLGKKTGYKYDYVPGVVGDTLVTIYEHKFDTANGNDSNYIMEALNTVTKQSVVLLIEKEKNYRKFQFLTNGKDVVFKQGKRVIDLRTLKKAQIDNNFQPIVYSYTFGNLGGGRTESQKESYSILDLRLHDKGAPLTLFLKP